MSSGERSSERAKPDQNTKLSTMQVPHSSPHQTNTGVGKVPVYNLITRVPLLSLLT